MTSTEFRKYYKTISLGELLDIVDNPDHYQPEAVEAARQELEDRQLPETAIDEARQPAVEKRLKRESEQERRNALNDKMIHAAQHFVGAVNPIQREPKRTDKIIKSIGSLYSLVGVVSMVGHRRSLLSAIREFPKYPGLGLLEWEPVILIIASVTGFFQKKRWGWLVLTGTSTFFALLNASLFYQTISWEISTRGKMVSLLRMDSPWVYVAPFLLLLASLYVLCKPDIREIFRIDKEKMWQAIVGAVLFFLAHIFFLY